MKLGQKTIILLILLMVDICGLTTSLATAQNKTTAQKNYPSPADDILKGIELLYNWEFDRAECIFKEYIQKNPDQPLGYFYKAMVTWSRLATGFWSPARVREYEKRVDETVSIAQKEIERGEADSFTYFYMGGALGFKGRLYLMKHEWFRAFKLALSAIESLEKCYDLDPNNKDVLLGLGIYEYYTARLSGVLKFLTYLFIRKGDKEKGIQKLNSAANEAMYAAVEAKSVLLHIHLFMESRYEEALPLALDLTGRFEKNPRFAYFLGLVYLKLNQRKDYSSVLRKIYERAEQYRDGRAEIWRHRAHYLEACEDVLSERHCQARKKLETILKEADRTVDPAMAVFPLLRIGMSYDLEGKRQKAIDCYQKILLMDNGAGAQFLAERYINASIKADDPFLGY